ncbi:MAG: hypothetical protein P8X55_04050, partial [Desulfosarcinaceae bacterium]
MNKCFRPLLVLVLVAATGAGCTGRLLPQKEATAPRRGRYVVIATATADDSLASLARTYLKDERRAWQIAAYNNINTVTAGQKVVIPLKPVLPGGLQTSGYPTEIPDSRELRIIFERFAEAPIRYWHDVGHAMIQERLGFDRAEELVRENAEKLAGTHLHDVTGYRDHLAPGNGDVDFVRLRSLLPEHAVKVIEVHTSTSLAELAGAFDVLDRLGYDGEGERPAETRGPDDGS